MRSSTLLLVSITVGMSQMTGTGVCSPPTSMTISVTSLYQPPFTGEGEVALNRGQRTPRNQVAGQGVGEVFEERI